MQLSPVERQWRVALAATLETVATGLAPAVERATPTSDVRQLDIVLNHVFCATPHRLATLLCTDTYCMLNGVCNPML